MGAASPVNAEPVLLEPLSWAMPSAEKESASPLLQPVDLLGAPPRLAARQDYRRATRTRDDGDKDHLARMDRRIHLTAPLASPRLATGLDWRHDTLYLSHQRPELDLHGRSRIRRLRAAVAGRWEIGRAHV